jgi:cob(I)alamin adenosyltransferase
VKNVGLIYVFTGEGKGKTSAALGVATRALLIDERVVWVAFYKGSDWELAEKNCRQIPQLGEYFTGRGFRIVKPEQMVHNVKIASVSNAKVVDTASEDEHIEAAKQGLKMVEQKLAEKPFLLVMDEVLNAISEGLLESGAVMEVLSQRGNTHIVMTGRAGTEPARTVLAGADLVTECKKIKHPYDNGKLAVRGLDF